MIKYIFLMIFSVSCFASQSTDQIINYCKREYLTDAGNIGVLACVREELNAQKELEKITKK